MTGSTPKSETRLKDGIADPLRRIAGEMFPELERRLAMLQARLADPAEAPALQASAAEQADAILVEMNQVLARMVELETFNEVLDLLGTIPILFVGMFGVPPIQREINGLAAQRSRLPNQPTKDIKVSGFFIIIPLTLPRSFPNAAKVATSPRCRKASPPQFGFDRSLGLCDQAMFP